MDTENAQSLAIIGAIIFAVLVSWFVGNITVASILGGALVVRLLQVFVYGKRESKETQRKEIQRKLTEIYSPIHYMLVKVRQHINLGDANGIGFLGGEVRIRDLESFEKVQQIFIDHTHELGEARVQKWVTNLQFGTIGGTPSLYVNKDLGDLFRELESEYQRLEKELNRL